jgi:hypothetical protein
MPGSRFLRWARDRWRNRADTWTRRRDASRRGRLPGAWRGNARHPIRGGLLNILAVAVAATAAIWVVHRNDQITYGVGRPDHNTVAGISLAKPFAGSPAQSYADGAKGVARPQAKAIGGFSVAQVAAAYRATRRLIVTAGLDPATLNGGRPSAFLRALGPGQYRSFFIAHLNDGAQSTRYEVVSFAAGTTRLIGDIIKVSGRMRARKATADGVHGLLVHIDYLFVYPVEQPGDPATLERLVVRMTGDVFYAPPDMTHPQTITQWLSSPTPARCDINNGFIYPTYNGSTPDRVQPSGASVDPYNQRAPQRSGGSCQSSTGT